MSLFIRFQNIEKKKKYLINKILALKSNYWTSDIRQFLLGFCDKAYCKLTSEELGDFDKKIIEYIDSITIYILDREILSLADIAKKKAAEIKKDIFSIINKSLDKESFLIVNKLLPKIIELNNILVIMIQEDKKLEETIKSINEYYDKCKEIFKYTYLNNSENIIITSGTEPLDFKTVITKYKEMENFGIEYISTVEKEIKKIEKKYNTTLSQQTTSHNLKNHLNNLKESIDRYKKISLETKRFKLLTEEFEQAYLSNNQKAIEITLKKFPEKTLHPYHIIGTNYPNFVYHSLSNTKMDSSEISKPRVFGDNLSDIPNMSPKEYALSIQQFVTTTGYMPSGRFLRHSIVGIRKINNIFIYFDPIYLNYSLVLIAFKPKDVCLIGYTGGIRGVAEGVIFTKKPILPKELEIYVRDPMKIEDPKQSKYVQEVIMELNNLGVRFIVDFKEGNLHR